MRGFDSTIESLLEVYSKCLSLLKELKGGDDSHSHEDQPRQLRKCIRSDRSKIRKVYSSRLTLNGSHLQEGDGMQFRKWCQHLSASSHITATARSSLRKIIKRLTSALTRLLSLGRGTRNPVIDYQSWRSLSNSSRVDAVKAINDLSRRLSSSAVRSSSSSSNKSKHARGTRAPGKLSNRRYKKFTSDKTSHGQHVEQTKPPNLPAGPSFVPQLDCNRRISMTTMSSGSTKLGEIYSSKIRPRHSECSAAADDFVARPTYPLMPYCTDSKRRRLWRFFERN